MAKRFMSAVGPDVPADELTDLSWAETSPRREKILAEAAKIQDVIHRLTGASSILTGNPIVDARRPVSDIGPDDVAQLWYLLETTVPAKHADGTNYTGLYRHLHLAGEYGREIAETSNDAGNAYLHPPAIEAACRINDIGKFGTFRYHLNDRVGQEILHGMGVREEVQRVLMPGTFNVGPLSLERYKESRPGQNKARVRAYAGRVRRALTDEQQAFILADILGKPKKDDPTQLVTWEDMEEYHMATRKSPEAYEELIGQNADWPSEKYAYNQIAGWAEGWLGIYRKLKAKWKDRGADVDEIRKRIQEGQS